jgi:hypothetical protein
MITLPLDFVPTRYEGYYWSVTENHLYTLKGGTLKPLKMAPVRIYMCGAYVYYPEGWIISHLGKKHVYPLRELMKLHRDIPDSEFPTRRQDETPSSSCVEH